MQKIQIDGTEFEVEQKEVYVLFPKNGKPNIMISSYDIAWDIHIHHPETHAVMDYKRFGSKEVAVKWAKIKGYIT